MRASHHDIAAGAGRSRGRLRWRANVSTMEDGEPGKVGYPSDVSSYVADEEWAILSFPMAAQCGQQREHQFSVGWRFMLSTTMTFDGTLAL